jgi:hypothetical protein
MTASTTVGLAKPTPISISIHGWGSQSSKDNWIRRTLEMMFSNLFGETPSPSSYTDKN